MPISPLDHEAALVHVALEVEVEVDAMTDLDAHNHSLTRIFPRLGQHGTTHEILDLLAKRFEQR